MGFFLLVRCLYYKIIHGYVEIWNFTSHVQLNLAALTRVNIRTEIPYLRTRMFYSLRFEIVRIVVQVKRKFVAIKQLNLSVHGKVGEARIVFVDYIYRM